MADAAGSQRISLEASDVSVPASLSPVTSMAAYARIDVGGPADAARGDERHTDGHSQPS
jgi:hypothetical protein